MERQPKFTHQQIVAYLNGDIKKNAQDQILKLREEDPVYDLLFDLIDAMKGKATIREKAVANVEISLTFSNLEEMLMRILARDARPTDAQLFIDGLLFSPVFYQRIISKLSYTAAQNVLENIPELAQVQVRSDEELLEQVVSEVKGSKPTNVVEPTPLPKIDFWIRLQKLISTSRMLPRYSYALIALIIISLGSFYTYENLIKKDVFDELWFDDKVPYKYDKSTLRASQELFEGDPSFQLFKNQFQLGMSDYVVHDYTSAIRTLENLQPIALALQAQLSSKEFLPWLRDFYFYLAISQLALSRSQRVNLAQDVKAKLAADAIRNLSHADSLVLTNRLKGSDRETYFLGLAYGFGGDMDSSVVQLRKIEPGSQFYKNSEKLINKWSD